MPRKITIHKPTHKFFGKGGTPALAIGQLRGDLLYLNLLDNGKVVEKTWAVGSAAYHLTGYGKGVSNEEGRAKDAMQAAWLFVFGEDVPQAEWSERHEVNP